jgi:hypothetical protein
MVRVEALRSWRGEGPDNLDCGVFFPLADANRPAAELFFGSQKAVNRARGIDVEANDLAAMIESENLGECGAWVINLGEDIPIEEIPMKSAAGVNESAHDLAAIIDSNGSGSRSARDIKLRKAVLFQEEAMKYAPASRNWLTIWPRSLIPMALPASVGSGAAPGKSIWLKAPLSKRKLCTAPSASAKAPTIWSRLLIPWA